MRITTLAMLALASISAPASASITFFTTNADLEAIATVQNPGGPPLVNVINVGWGGAADTAVYTNQISGPAGGVGGDAVVRTAFAGRVTSMRSPNQNPISGPDPNAGQLVFFAGLEGTLVNGSVEFTTGTLFVAQLAGNTFESTQPLSFGSYNILESFVLTDASVLQGANPPGAGGGSSVPADASDMNDSVQGTLIGDTAFKFLFTKEGPADGDFVSSVDPQFGDPGGERDFGFFLAGNQILETLYQDNEYTESGAEYTLGAGDLAVLNQIMTDAGFADLSDANGDGAFATYLGTDPYGFSSDPAGLRAPGGPTGTGDLVAYASGLNGYPVVEGIVPEPTTLVVWGALLSLAGVTSGLRKRIA